MEAAEKIPKKLYVYLDTTRGPDPGDRRPPVHCGRTSAGVWDRRQCDLRADPVGDGTVLTGHGVVEGGTTAKESSLRRKAEAGNMELAATRPDHVDEKERRTGKLSAFFSYPVQR